jgi:antitoxin (DNA-binding transcriptional repressor) of toxin-antitoxin stability system
MDLNTNRPGLPPKDLGDKFAAMTTISIQHVQTKFEDILRRIASGEEFKVVQSKRTVAKIVSPGRSPSGRSSRKNRRGGWAQHFAKLDAIYNGKPAPGKAASRIILEGRR